MVNTRSSSGVTKSPFIAQDLPQTPVEQQIDHEVEVTPIPIGSDSKYEFSAPKFVNFQEETDLGEGDSWFEFSKDEHEYTTSSAPNAVFKLSETITVTQQKETIIANDQGVTNSTDVPLSLEYFEGGDGIPDSNDERHEEEREDQDDNYTENENTDGSGNVWQRPQTFPNLLHSFEAFTSSTPTSVKENMNSAASSKSTGQKQATIGADRYKKSVPHAMTHSTKPLTIPIEFNFQETQKRQRLKRSPVKKNDILKPVSSGISKRKQTKRVPVGLTIPEPFKFHSTTRTNAFAEIAKATLAKSPFVPLAVRVKKYEEQLSDHKLEQKPVEKFKPNNLTIPKSPALLTKFRTKYTNVLSTEQRELQEMETSHFKAKPINPRIFESAGDHGVPRVKKAEVTIPHSPAITKPKTLPQRPVSPPRIIHANPIRIPEIPFEPHLEHHATNPVPFNLPGEAIHQAKLKELEENKNKEEEERTRMRQFKAQPLPSDSPDPLPPKFKLPITELVPFDLETDARGEQYQENFRQKLKLWRQLEKENRFRAHSIPKMLDNPFRPQKSTKPLTEIIDFSLHTELRAEERKHFDDVRKEREREDEMLIEQKRKQDEIRERGEIRCLRQKLVHHPEPIKRQTVFQVQPSNKKLTEPVSPLIGDKRGRRVVKKRSGRDNSNDSHRLFGMVESRHQK